MDARDIFSADEKDKLLNKLYGESSQVKIDGNPIHYSYMTKDEYEVAVIGLFIEDGLVDEVAGLSGYATYRHTPIASYFINRGGYKRLQTLERSAFTTKGNLFNFSISIV